MESEVSWNTFSMVQNGEHSYDLEEKFKVLFSSARRSTTARNEPT